MEWAQNNDCIPDLNGNSVRAERHIEIATTNMFELNIVIVLISMVFLTHWAATHISTITPQKSFDRFPFFKCGKQLCAMAARTKYLANAHFSLCRSNSLSFTTILEIVVTFRNLAFVLSILFEFYHAPQANNTEAQYERRMHFHEQRKECQRIVAALKWQ